MNYQTSASRSGIWILFLLWPFMALIQAIRNPRRKWAINVLWMFIVFHGFTMPIISKGTDANTYRDWFYEMVEKNMSFTEFTESLYSQESAFVDVLQPMVTFILSKFTADESILFMFFGLILGYFYSRNIGFLLEQSKGVRLDGYAWLLIAVFAVIVGFWEINGFRYWTAAHIFFFGVIRIIFKKDNRGWFFIVLSLFTHFAFVIPVGLFVLHYFLPVSYRLLFWVFLATFLISEVDFAGLHRTINDYAPAFLEKRVETYVSEDIAEKMVLQREELSWHAKFYGSAMKWAVIVFVIFIYIRGKKFFNNNKNIKRLFSWSLLLLSLGNLASLIPSGGRYLVVANLFVICCVFLIYVYAENRYKMKRLIILLTPLLLFFGVVSFRIGADFMGADLLINNPLIAWLFQTEMALIDFIK